APGGAHPESSERTASTQSDLTVSVGPRSLSHDFLDVSFLPAGIAADEKVVFVGDPLEGRVLGYSRSCGNQVGELPQPPGGFVLPFIMHSLGSGRVAVLDAGG